MCTYVYYRRRALPDELTLTVAQSEDLLQQFAVLEETQSATKNVTALIQLIGSSLDQKLAHFELRLKQDERAWTQTERQRPLHDDEQWGLCCIYWEDYICLDYSMPGACSHFRTREGVCAAACNSFDVCTGASPCNAFCRLPAEKLNH